MPKAYSYTRFSTPEQRKGDSAARQSRRVTEYLQQHPELELDQSLQLSDLGVSAFDKSNLAKGAGLRAFLDAVDRGVVTPGSFLLVESLDRLSRAQVLDAFQLFSQILERGITVVTLLDGVEYSKEKANRQFTDLMMSLVILSRSHEESLTKSKRLSEAWENKRRNIHQRKLTRTCPSWLELSPDRTTYLPIKRKVALIREAVSMLLSGVGKDAIAKKFNERGIHSIGNKRDRQTWYGSYVTKILKNRALIGEFQPHRVVNKRRVAHGAPVADYFPRILSDEEFSLVQHVIDQRGRKAGGRRGKAFPNLFTGLVRCGYCGSTMVYMNKGVDRRTGRTLPHNVFLVCHRAKRGAGCHYVTWTYSEVENGILSYARGLDFLGFIKSGGDRDASIRAIANDIGLTKNKLVEITARRDRLVDVLEDAAKDAASPPSAVLSRIAQHEREIEALEKTSQELELKLKAAAGYAHVNAESADAIQQLLHDLRSKAGEDLYLLRARLNEHFRHLLSHIHIYGGGVIYSKSEVKALREELMTSGQYTQEQVDRDLPKIASTVPDKKQRFLVLRRRSDEIQVLRPQEEFPDLLAAAIEVPQSLRRWMNSRRAELPNG